MDYELTNIPGAVAKRFEPGDHTVWILWPSGMLQGVRSRSVLTRAQTIALREQYRFARRRAVIEASRKA